MKVKLLIPRYGHQAKEHRSSWSLGTSLNISSGLGVIPKVRRTDDSVICQTEKGRTQDSFLLFECSQPNGGPPEMIGSINRLVRIRLPSQNRLEKHLWPQTLRQNFQGCQDSVNCLSPLKGQKGRQVAPQVTREGRTWSLSRPQSTARDSCESGLEPSLPALVSTFTTGTTLQFQF